ncbi:MAG TPA: choice-of-anchor D domain-containing protein [Terriglobia bacterium]|nr:choice-of-anchor D domain-containing protein [Terriglobia bacterium]
MNRADSHRLGQKPALVVVVFAVLFWVLSNAAAATSATISYVQGNYKTPQSPQTTVMLTFNAAQTAGDLNVVAVGWNDSTATVIAVTDTGGNTYTLAVGPTVQGGVASQSIYYAKDIAAASAGANTVTVTFSVAAAYPDIRILEYSGADPNNPVDVAAAGTGSGKSTSSASATTTNATDLILGANLVQTATTGPGSGFTKRLLTSPDGDIAEDRMATATGSYSAKAPDSPSGKWIMQMVAFRTPVVTLGSFAVSASPASLSVAQGKQGTSTVITTISGSFSSSISLSASGAPSGTTVSFNPSTIAAPGAGNSTMTIVVGASTPLGTYPVTVTGNGGGVQQSATVTLIVTAAPTFTLSASPASVSVVQGNQGTSTITTTVSGSFSSSISLSASGAPSGATVSFNPGTITAPGAGSSTMTMTVGSSTPTGTYPITVTGSGGGVQQNATVTLTIATASTTITYVQGNYSTPQTAQSTVTVPFTAAQTVGDLNVVVVGWNDASASVKTVTDISGNTYALAVGPTILSSGPVSQSIYYAKNVAAAAAGANSVTVTFSTAAVNSDIRIVEYSGADPSSPVDVTAVGSGSSATTSSAAATTTNPTDLIFGANIVYTSTTGPGSGFTQRLLTSPDGDIAEDQMVAATGTYSASAPLSSSGAWIMQMVAFRTPSGGGAPPTYLLSASPTSLNFGNVTVGTQNVLPIILTNIGTGAVTLTQDTITGAGFSGSGLSLPFTLSSGQNTDLSITFAPAAAGSATGSASVVSNASGSPTVVSLSGAGVNSHYVSLSWAASTSSGVTGYNICRGTTSGGPYTQINSSLISATTYTDSNVVAGQAYYYVTTAVNSSGVQSGYSNEASATVPNP